jgi:Polyketide cyclase / dehydrase and lipid transport
MLWCGMWRTPPLGEGIDVVRVEGEIVINRPVEEVFDFVADERNEPRYNPRMGTAELITEGPIGVGSRFRAVTVSMGRSVEMIIEFTGYERSRRLASSTHLSSMDLAGTLTFEPLAGGTRMRWSWEVAPRGALRLLSPLVGRMGRSQERRIWTGLKRLLEEQRPPPASA